MFWEELTGDLFEKAIKQVEGVCLLPLSCIERHSHHLPLATDMLIGRELCRRAAALEPAIVFPNYIFTQILEAQHCAGTIAIEPDLIMRLLDNVCREIARNGLKKIVIVNAHGGTVSASNDPSGGCRIAVGKRLSQGGSANCERNQSRSRGPWNGAASRLVASGPPPCWTAPSQP